MKMLVKILASELKMCQPFWIISRFVLSCGIPSSVKIIITQPYSNCASDSFSPHDMAGKWERLILRRLPALSSYRASDLCARAKSFATLKSFKVLSRWCRRKSTKRIIEQSERKGKQFLSFRVVQGSFRGTPSSDESDSEFTYKRQINVTWRSQFTLKCEFKS